MGKKTIIVLGLTVLTVPAFFFLLNCAQQGPGASTNGGGQGGGEGFSPNGLSRGEGDGREGFSPNQGYQYSSQGHSSRTESESDPFRKSPSVADNEKRWGPSAPIGKVKDDDIDQDVLEDFLLGEEINTMDDIVDLRVYVKLRKAKPRTDISRKTYGGKITVAYYDYSIDRPRRIELNSGTGDNAKYNVWIDKKETFHGFFQDTGGSAILVINKETPLATGPEGSKVNTLFGGSIWIMTFKVTKPLSKTTCAKAKNGGVYVRDHNNNLPLQEKTRSHLSQRSKKCWFISKGPFDCRSWRSGSGVNTLQAVEPHGDCYTKLGDFSGLDVLEAFGVKKLDDLY